MVIERLAGTDVQLYRLIAPLVMNPGILRQNHDYPFKTSKSHIWFGGLKDSVVVGFIPVELRGKSAVINNYYVSGDDSSVLISMLQEAIQNFGEKYKLQSVTHTRHISDFQSKGFSTIRTWKLYVKMEYRKM